MVPTSFILNALQQLLADDPNTLSSATALHVHLIMDNFLPGPNTELADLTPATFTGSTPANAGIGDAQTFTDPATGNRIIQLLEPAGGWHWQASDAVNLPQTIYGYAVTDNTDTDTYGSALLSEPIELLQAGDGLDLPQVRFTLSPSALS